MPTSCATANAYGCLKLIDQNAVQDALFIRNYRPGKRVVRSPATEHRREAATAPTYPRPRRSSAGEAGEAVAVMHSGAARMAQFRSPGACIYMSS